MVAGLTLPAPVVWCQCGVVVVVDNIRAPVAVPCVRRRFWLATKGRRFCVALGYSRLSMMVHGFVLRQAVLTWKRFTRAEREYDHRVETHVKKVCCLKLGPCSHFLVPSGIAGVGDGMSA